MYSMDLGILWYLVPSVLMFACGVYGFVTRKNLIAILVSLELMLNAADLNFVAFNRYLFPGQMEGMVFTLFAIAIAAAETAIAIAIIINVYRAVGNTDINEISKMKYGHYTSNFDFGDSHFDVPYLRNRRGEDEPQDGRSAWHSGHGHDYGACLYGRIHLFLQWRLCIHR